MHQIIGDYVIRKIVTSIDSRFGITSLMGNIQNSFVDSDEKTLMFHFSGYPSFETDTTNRSKTFNSAVGVSTNAYTINISGHNFINGEQIYLQLGKDVDSGSGLLGINTGYYFVNVIDSNTIKSSTQANLFNKLLEQPRFIDNTTGINTIFQNVTHTITSANLHKRVKLQNQDHFKRIYKNPKISTKKSKTVWIYWCIFKWN